MVAYHMPDRDLMRESLHPQARAVLEEAEAFGLENGASPSLADKRRLQPIQPRFSGEPAPVGAIRDVLVDGPAGAVPVRLYVPEAPGPHPAVLFIHGGGWALGAIEYSDPVCRALCRASEMLIASVDYRLAPEHPFPAGLDDSYAVLRWLDASPSRIGARPGLIAVCGDSAGGNLAAAVALVSRDRAGPPITVQVLIYPALDPTLSGPSFETYAQGYGLTRDDMRLFWELYLKGPGDVSNPYASPLLSPALGGLPPAVILVAECDPLTDDGEAYAGLLRAAGVIATVIRYPGMIHGFIGHLGRVDAAHAAVADCAAALKSAMGQSSPAT